MRGEGVTVIDGKVCLITGGSAGIGFGTARLMCAEGAQVVITGRDRERGQVAQSRLRADGGNARYLHQDVTLPESWAHLIDTIRTEHGALHVLVNNAGAYLRKPMTESSFDDFDRIIAINLRAAFIGIQAALPLMTETARHGPSGSIINVSSDSAVRAFAMQSIYNASKGALDVLTRTLAREFAELGHNVRVNGVNPYFTTSDMTDALFENILLQGGHQDRDALAEAVKAPIGRVGTPEDTGQMILFLASDKSEFINGTNTLVDGAASVGGGDI